MRIQLNYALRKRERRIYFFDENGIYKTLEVEDAINANIKNIFEDRKGEYRIGKLFLNIKNGTIEKKAICLLKEGDSVERLIELLETTNLEKKLKPKGLDRFITKIYPPKFDRIPENKKTNTFDYIFVDVATVNEWNEDKKEYIKKHFDEILQRVIQTLQENRKFQKFSVPVNFLKISRITLRRDDVIEFVLELKSV